MKLTSWKDIRAEKFTPEELRQIDEEVEQELRSLAALGGELEGAEISEGERGRHPEGGAV